MKCLQKRERLLRIPIAPFAGAWIEMPTSCGSWVTKQIAPFAGAWIEIKSLSSSAGAVHIAPFAGAWIEMTPLHRSGLLGYHRTLRGCVD